MRRIACGISAAVLSSFAVAAPAMADNELTDKCGTADLSLPALVNQDVTASALDLCGADVRGTAGSGTLRAVHATLRMAGDTAQRGSASYWFEFAAGGCGTRLVYEDLVPPTGPGRLVLDGRCGGTWKACQTMDPTEDCGYWVGGVPYRRVLPNTAFKLAGSTVTLDFDPNTVPVGAAPRQFLDGFQPGKALTSLGAMTWVRGQAGTTDDDGVYWFVDQASSDKPLALGGSSRTRARR